MSIWKKIQKGARWFTPTHIPSHESCAKSRAWCEIEETDKETNIKTHYMIAIKE